MHGGSAGAHVCRAESSCNTTGATYATGTIYATGTGATYATGTIYATGTTNATGATNTTGVAYATGARYATGATYTTVVAYATGATYSLMSVVAPTLTQVHECTAFPSLSARLMHLCALPTTRTKFTVGVRASNRARVAALVAARECSQ